MGGRTARRLTTRLGELDCQVVDALPEGATPELVVVLCHGLGAPAKTPAAVIKKLENAMNESLKNPKVLERFTQLGVEPMVLTADGFKKHITAEADKWAKVIKTQGIQAIN